MSSSRENMSPGSDGFRNKYTYRFFHKTLVFLVFISSVFVKLASYFLRRPNDRDVSKYTYYVSSRIAMVITYPRFDF